MSIGDFNGVYDSLAIEGAASNFMQNKQRLSRKRLEDTSIEWGDAISAVNDKLEKFRESVAVRIDEDEN